MIAIQSESGELIKILGNVFEGEYGFHKNFGLISKDAAKKRVTARKRQHYDYTNDEWLCSFNIKNIENELNVSPLNGCEVISMNGAWLLKTPAGVFNISNNHVGTIAPLIEDHEDKNSWLNKFALILIASMFVFIPVMMLINMKPAPQVVVEEKLMEPVTVQIKQDVPHEIRTVKIEQTYRPETGSKLIPNLKGVSSTSRRAVERNLGFLGMVGSKEITGAIGGVPQHLKVATAGAGPGGTGGSGGESLTGLGKGLRKTTVGNTGVQGLGGIGTKGGAGGGLGGYGNTLVASGEGKGISAIAVSNNEMTLEGGISKYAINATIAKYLNQVRRCYETELKNKPDLQGLVEMSFEINATGKLNFSKVSKTTLENATVENCISTKMMDWQFPQPKGGVNVAVKYPFMLRPVGI